jgi:hypothetical protein
MRWRGNPALRVRVLLMSGALATAFLATSSTVARADAGCPNEAFRTGPSATLPDCRAYERVTPADLNGRKPEFDLTYSNPPNLTASELASPAGDSYVFFTQAEPLLEPQGSNGTYDVYETVRTSAGWETIRRLTPTGSEAELPSPGGLSPDHQYSFFALPLNGENGGLRQTTGPGTYIQTPSGSIEPLGIGSLGIEIEAEGRWITAQGDHIIFTTGGPYCSSNCIDRQLEPNAPATGTPAVYDRSASGETRVISLLPGDITPNAGEGAEYQGASGDGSAVAFKIADTLYVRVNNTVTEQVTGPGATFAGVSVHGETVSYVRSGDIFQFDVASQSTQQVNPSGDAEVTHVSETGSFVYFISPSQLDGLKGSPGADNLYAWEAASDTIAFVATVSSADVNGSPGLGNWTKAVVLPSADMTAQLGPGFDGSRTSADGSVLAFESTAKLTPYENAGHVEIYRWDAPTGSLTCVSCNLDEEPATSDARFESLEGTAHISAHVVVNNLSADGAQIVFETAEGLVPRDSDGTNDIYESRGESGVQPSLSLISSGQTPVFRGELSGIILPANQIAAVTPSGNDIFFRTTDGLLPSAGTGGVPAVYDARVDGGFLEPITQSCSGEACQPTLAPPEIRPPLSTIFSGLGNVRCKPTPKAKKTAQKGGGNKGKHSAHKKRARKSTPTSCQQPGNKPTPHHEKKPKSNRSKDQNANRGGGSSKGRAK